MYMKQFCRFASICFSFHVSRVKSELHPANSTWIRPEPDSWKERQISNQFYFIIMHTMLKEGNNNCCFNIINTFTNQTNTTFQFNFIQVILYSTGTGTGTKYYVKRKQKQIFYNLYEKKSYETKRLFFKFFSVSASLWHE